MVAVANESPPFLRFVWLTDNALRSAFVSAFTKLKWAKKTSFHFELEKAVGGNPLVMVLFTRQDTDSGSSLPGLFLVALAMRLTPALRKGMAICLYNF